MLGSAQSITSRLAGAIDLAIDLATLGEYGLEAAEETPARESCAGGRRGPAGLTAGWEAPVTPRRGSCQPAPARSRTSRSMFCDVPEFVS